MKQKTKWKRSIKAGVLVLLAIGFLALTPQLMMGVEGAVFGAVWLTMAMLGAVSLYRQHREERKKAAWHEVYAFKKKLRTPGREARSRITVRLKA